MNVSKNIMVFELDSVNQRDIALTSESPAAAISKITGMIRSALVISGEILVTDSMLLDGWYFQVLGPRGLASELGVSRFNLPLRVVGLAGTLKNSLGDKLANGTFLWQTRTSDDLPWPTPEVKSVWDDWCRAQEEQHFAYATVTKPSGQTLELVRAGVAEYFAGYPANIVELANEHETTSARSPFFKGYLQLKESLREDDGQLGEKSRRHLKDLYSWWNGAYLELIAQQNRANWISFDRGGDPSGARRKTSGHSFRVSAVYLAKMESLTPGAYGTVISSIDESRTNFGKKLTARSLRGLIYSATECLTAPQRERVWRSALFRGVLALAVIMISIPALDLSGIGLVTAWVTFGVAAVATFPWGDARTLISLLETSDRIELVMKRNE